MLYQWVAIPRERNRIVQIHVPEEPEQQVVVAGVRRTGGSDRTEYSAISNSASGRRSGGIDGTTDVLVHLVDHSVEAPERLVRQSLDFPNGCVAGTPFPGDVSVSNPICESLLASHAERRSQAGSAVDPLRGLFSPAC